MAESKEQRAEGKERSPFRRQWGHSAGRTTVTAPLRAHRPLPGKISPSKNHGVGRARRSRAAANGRGAGLRSRRDADASARMQRRSSWRNRATPSTTDLRAALRDRLRDRPRRDHPALKPGSSCCRIATSFGSCACRRRGSSRVATSCTLRLAHSLVFYLKIDVDTSFAGWSRPAGWTSGSREWI